MDSQKLTAQQQQLVAEVARGDMPAERADSAHVFFEPAATVPHLLAQMLTGQDAAARGEAVTRLVELEEELLEANQERKLLQEQETHYRKIIARYLILDRRHQRRERLAQRDRRRKLTLEQVKEMRLAWNNGNGMSMGQLAKRYHRSKSTVWNILQGYCWANE